MLVLIAFQTSWSTSQWLRDFVSTFFVLVRVALFLNKYECVRLLRVPLTTSSLMQKCSDVSEFFNIVVDERAMAE